MLQRDILHATQLHRQTRLAQALGTLLGQRLTVAGLRGPKQQVLILHRQGLRFEFNSGNTLTGHALQRHGAVLERGLQRHRVNGIAGDSVDCQEVAVNIVPVKRGKTIARQNPCGDPCRQYGLATA
ncbi:hypothetical protein D3C72_1367550 [compost metagenome]